MEGGLGSAGGARDWWGYHSGDPWAAGNIRGMLSSGTAALTRVFQLNWLCWEQNWRTRKCFWKYRLQAWVHPTHLKIPQTHPTSRTSFPYLHKYCVHSPQIWLCGWLQGLTLLATWGRTGSTPNPILLYKPPTVLINTYQCSSTCLLSVLVMLCLLVWDTIIHAMLITGIWGYLCQANCCGIAVFMLS